VQQDELWQIMFRPKISEQQNLQDGCNHLTMERHGLLCHEQLVVVEVAEVVEQQNEQHYQII
jgi:hypothetical protein